MKARRIPGVMNKTEAMYAERLHFLGRMQEILEYRFEALTFKLAADLRYTPDFMVRLPDDTVEFHEVKGFWRDDAKAKIKMAAKEFPWIKFIVAVRVGKEFRLTEIPTW